MWWIQGTWSGLLTARKQKAYIAHRALVPNLRTSNKLKIYIVFVIILASVFIFCL
jgi:hypothetical protein